MPTPPPDTEITELDNALVRQKDRILRLANNGCVEAATHLIDFCEDLWRGQGYAYKTAELRAIVARERAAKDRQIELSRAYAEDLG